MYGNEHRLGKDHHKRGDWNASMPPYQAMMQTLTTMLRNDMLYLAVSQNDIGLDKHFMVKRPNVLVLSVGGFGHGKIRAVRE